MDLIECGYQIYLFTTVTYFNLLKTQRLQIGHMIASDTQRDKFRRNIEHDEQCSMKGI